MNELANVKRTRFKQKPATLNYDGNFNMVYVGYWQTQPRSSKNTFQVRMQVRPKKLEDKNGLVRFACK